MKVSLLSLFLLAMSTSHGEPTCEQFTTISATTSITDILDAFQVTTADLALLNPRTDLTNLVHGSRLCLVGTTEDKAIGSRPVNLVQYQTTPGTDTCINIIKLSKPPFSIQTFEELNANLECRFLDFHGGTVFLPSGTTVGNNRTSSSAKHVLRSTFPTRVAANNQDCIVGPWGDWTPCLPVGTQARFRNIFVPASGSGNFCPETFETRSCDGGRERNLLELTQCPVGYDGCSVPEGLKIYHLFTPACNVHDICYSCNRHTGWEFATKKWCDDDFYHKMMAQCDNYWTNFWQRLDLSRCHHVAGMYLAAVKAGGNPDDFENPPNDDLLEDGCYWHPWDDTLNNANRAGFSPASSGCPCVGRSCDWW